MGLESVLAIAFAVTGLIIAWHRPATPMTFLTSVSLILYGVKSKILFPLDSYIYWFRRISFFAESS